MAREEKEQGRVISRAYIVKVHAACALKWRIKPIVLYNGDILILEVSKFRNLSRTESAFSGVQCSPHACRALKRIPSTKGKKEKKKIQRSIFTELR